MFFLASVEWWANADESYFSLYFAMNWKSMAMAYSASFLKASWYCLQVWSRTLSNFCWWAAAGRMPVRATGEVASRPSGGTPNRDDPVRRACRELVERPVVSSTLSSSKGVRRREPACPEPVEGLVRSLSKGRTVAGPPKGGRGLARTGE